MTIGGAHLIWPTTRSFWQFVPFLGQKIDILVSPSPKFQWNQSALNRSVPVWSSCLHTRSFVNQLWCVGHVYTACVRLYAFTGYHRRAVRPSWVLWWAAVHQACCWTGLWFSLCPTVPSSTPLPQTGPSRSRHKHTREHGRWGSSGWSRTINEPVRKRKYHSAFF